MIGEHADDGVVRGRAVTGEGGEEDVFLDAEVFVSYLVPEEEERVACVSGGRAGGAREALGDNEPVVVVAGELARASLRFTTRA